MDSNTESESGDDTSSSVESKMAHLEKSENLEQELRELFEYLDADRDSVLDKDEFERAFFELEMFVDTKELDRLFDKYSSKVYDDEIGVNFHSFKAVLRELTKRKERKKRSFLSARKLVKVLSRMGHVKNSIRDSIVRAISPIKKSRKKSKKSSMWDVTSIENDQLRLVVSLLSLFPPSYNHTHTHTHTQQFDHMDGDNSGDINRDEMITTLRHLGMYRSINQIDNLFEQVTGSREGKIRFKHFCELIMHTRTAANRSISLHHLSQRMSKGFSELISQVQSLEVIKMIVDLLTAFVVVATLWETVFFVFLRNIDFEVEWDAYVLDLMCIIICLARVFILNQSKRKHNKIVPDSTILENKNKVDDDDDDDDDDERPVSPKIKRNQSLRVFNDSMTTIPDYEVATFLISLVPLDMFVYYIGLSWAVLFRLNRLVRLLRLPFLVRDLALFVSMLKYLPPLKVRMIVYLFFVLAFFAHFYGCMFYFIAVQETRDSSTNKTWGYSDGLWDIKDDGKIEYLESESHRYARSLYWAIVTLLTVGFGDITPEKSSSVEMTFTIVTMYTGALVSCAIVGCIVHAFSSGDTTAAMCRQRREGVSTYMRTRGLPMNLQRCILEYFTNLERKLKGFDKNKIEKSIPDPLHIQMRRSIMEGLLKSMDSLKILNGIRGSGSTGCRGMSLMFVSLLFEREDSLTRSRSSLTHTHTHTHIHTSHTTGQELAKVLQNEIAEALMQDSQVFSPDQIIKAKGDTIVGLYVLADGIANVCEEDNKILARLGQGDVIEEEAVWHQVLGESGFTVQHTVRARTYCTIYVLDAERFEQCLRQHLFPRQIKLLETEVTKHFAFVMKMKQLLSHMVDKVRVSTSATRSNNLWCDQGSSFRALWDILLCLCLIVQTVLFPLQLLYVFEISWPSTRLVNIHIAVLLTDIVFAIDIVLNAIYFTFTHEGVVVSDPSSIWTLYSRSWFLLDLISILPMRHIVILVSSNPLYYFLASSGQVFRWIHVVEYASKASSVRLLSLDFQYHTHSHTHPPTHTHNRYYKKERHLM